MSWLSSGIYPRKTCRWIVVLSVSSGLFLTGCASKYGQQMTNPVYYKNCYAPIQKLRDEEQEYKNTIVKGAVVGALAGAITGLAARGDGKGALVGGLIGLGLGMGTAFAMAEYKQMENDRDRHLYLSKGMITDAMVLDRLSISAASASDCYHKQFDKILTDYKAGRISKENFQERAIEIITGLNEIAAITKQSGADAEKQMAQYQDALQEIPESHNQIEAQQRKKVAYNKKKSKNKSTTTQPTEDISEVTANNAKLLDQINTDLKTKDQLTAQSTGHPVAKAGPDPSTMPGVVAIRDNLTAQQDHLTKVDKQVVTAKEECITLAEKEGVQIPDALKPKNMG